MVENNDDPTLKTTAKWRNHPSILALASEYKNRANDLTKIKMLMSRRPFRRVTFPLKLSRQRRISLQKQFFFYFNKSLENGKFPDCLELVNITPVFKKSKNNYRSVSILPVFFQRSLKGYLAHNF